MKDKLMYWILWQIINYLNAHFVNGLGIGELCLMVSCFGVLYDMMYKSYYNRELDNHRPISEEQSRKGWTLPSNLKKRKCVYLLAVKEKYLSGGGGEATFNNFNKARKQLLNQKLIFGLLKEAPSWKKMKMRFSVPRTQSNLLSTISKLRSLLWKVDLQHHQCLDFIMNMLSNIYNNSFKRSYCFEVFPH